MLTALPVRSPPAYHRRPHAMRDIRFASIRPRPTRAPSRCAGQAGSCKSRGSDISPQQSSNLDFEQDAEKRVSLEVRTLLPKGACALARQQLDMSAQQCHILHRRAYTRRCPLAFGPAFAR